MAKEITHPIANVIGLKMPLNPDTTLYFYPDPTKESPWEVARISLMGEHEFQFSIKDVDRTFGATFDREGEVLQLECDTGLPRGATEEVVAMFCENARFALEDMILLQ